MSKVALVTGARKGLGLAWVKELAKRDYTVYLTARKLEQAEAAARPFSEKVIPIALNVMDENSIAAAVKQVNSEQGRLDVLINNAGVNPKNNPNKEQMEGAFYLDKLNAEALLPTLHANSIAPLLVIKHFRSLLKLAEQPKIINISSWLDSVSNIEWGYHFGYCGSKNLLNMFNKMAANDLKADGVVSVCVNPGWVQTDMGGSKAEFTPEESVQNIIENVLERVTLNDSGKFLNHTGEIHPW